MHSPHRGHEERGHAGGPPRKADRAASCGRGGVGGGQPELQGQRVCHQGVAQRVLHQGGIAQHCRPGQAVSELPGIFQAVKVQASLQSTLQHEDDAVFEFTCRKLFYAGGGQQSRRSMTGL